MIAPLVVSAFVVAVPDFQNAHAPQLSGTEAARALAGALLDSGCAETLLFQEMPSEVAAGLAGCLETECWATLGQRLRANVVLSGTLSQFSTRILITITAIDVARRQSGEPTYFRPRPGEDIATAIRGHASDICRLINPTWRPPPPPGATNGNAAPPSEPSPIPAQAPPAAASAPPPAPTHARVDPSPAPPAPAAATEPAATAPRPEHVPRKSVALLGVTRGEGISAPLASTIEEMLLGQLEATRRYRVIGRSDMNTLLTLEARRQALGCQDSGCVAEIAGALGVDLVATADAGTVGNSIVVSLKVIDERTALVSARAQRIVATPDAIPSAARDVVLDVTRALWPSLNITLPPVRPLPPRWLRPTGWAGVGVGAGALAIGLVLELVAGHGLTVLKGAVRPVATQEQKMNAINAESSGAAAMFIGGGALAVSGAGVLIVF